MTERSKAPPFSLPQLDFQQFHQLFFDEAQDNLDELERLLLDTRAGADQESHLQALFRCAHSIKGGAATFGFDAVARLAHAMETLLDAWRKGHARPSSECIEHMLAASDAMRAMVVQHARGQAVAPAVIARAQEAAQTLHQHGGAGQRAQDAAPAEGDAGGAAPATGDVAREGEDFGWFDDDAPGVPPGQSHSDTPHHSEPPLVAEDWTAPWTDAAGNASSVRVPIGRIDGIVDLVGELIVAQTTLQQAVTALPQQQRSHLAPTIRRQKMLLRSLREAVMQARMVPASQLFQRLPRLVHALAQRLGKQVRLETSGDATELDKAVVERLTDPLIQLVRNSMDHGFETPAQRRQAGKPEVGRLQLAARHEGAEVVIEVRDDGRGLSREQLLARAHASGVAMDADAPDAQVWQLAFTPGLSTSDAVTDISGRGVGMDVVQSNVHALGGRIAIESRVGEGTVVTLWLPLTLAITDGLLVQVGSERYVLPLAAVEASMPAGQADIQTVQGVQMLMRLRGDAAPASRPLAEQVPHGGYCPIVALDTLLGVRRQDGSQACNATLVVLRSGTRRVAVLVDVLLDHQQVVVKNVERHFRKLPYVAAATLLGDGAVALILDVAQLANARLTEPQSATAATLSNPRAPRGDAAGATAWQ
ncbi:chemotaxis protein CheA [Lampropedia cohaerens]|uniref:chemotaxis protein CheA n=1 Tax=Lampropedia cohaerens TaxID=1610491 RepID=UPI0018D23ED2|nr:chemotaxis protein CheA [Lampropedia cohaerens]